MSKHTPGPWNFDSGYIDTHAVDDDGSTDYIILAELHSTFGPDKYGVNQWMLPPEEYEANGRLIAAAPEMLEALQMFLAYNDQGAPLSFDTDAMWAKARSVVAKIEGGEA